MGDGDRIDFLPIPGEGIINLYALYLGLCQLVHDGSITEQSANIKWLEHRNTLIQNRQSASKRSGPICLNIKSGI